MLQTTYNPFQEMEETRQNAHKFWGTDLGISTDSLASSVTSLYEENGTLNVEINVPHNVLIKTLKPTPKGAH